MTYSLGGLADGRQPEEELENYYLKGIQPGVESYIVLPVIDRIDCQGGHHCNNPNTQIQFTIVSWVCVEIVQFSTTNATVDWVGEIVHATDGQCVIPGGTTGGTPPDAGDPVIKTVGLIS